MFKDGETVTIPMLFEAKIVRDNNMPVKLLGNGEITKKLTIQVNAASAEAKNWTKVIKAVRSPKTGAYTFKENIVHKDKVTDFLKEK